MGHTIRIVDELTRAFQILEYWLNKRTEKSIELLRRDGEVVLQPTIENSYAISIDWSSKDDLIVYSHEWHNHVEDGEEAASLAFWLMTPYQRTVYELRNGEPWASWLESYLTDWWEPESCVYFQDPLRDESWLVSSDQPIERHTLQQRVLDWENPIQQLRPGIVLGPDGLPLGSYLGHKVETDTEASQAMPINAPSSGRWSRD